MIGSNVPYKGGLEARCTGNTLVVTVPATSAAPPSGHTVEVLHACTCVSKHDSFGGRAVRMRAFGPQSSTTDTFFTFGES